jgi:hypothetical protein
MDVLTTLNTCGYATTECGEVSDVFLKANGLLVIRGCMVDGIFYDNVAGRAILRKHNERLAKRKKRK